MPNYLDISEYDAAYFGRHPSLWHRAGYSNGYKKFPWTQPDDPLSSGELFLTRAKHIIDKFGIPNNHRVLELGCAFGYLVEGLRSLGVDAYGLDLPYPIGVAAEENPALAPYLYTGDARTALSQFQNNYWDLIISISFLVCIPPNDMPSLVSSMNTKSRKQAHVIDELSNDPFYTSMPLSEWGSLYDWKKGTILMHRIPAIGIPLSSQWIVV